MKKNICSLFIVFFPVVLIYAQTAVDTAKPIIKPGESVTPVRTAKTPAELVKEFLRNETVAAHDTNLSRVGPAGIYQADKRLDSVQLEAWKSYYGYMSTGYKHRANVFSWQLLSSGIIFCVVIFLVLTGIYFAWLQFKLALKKIEKEQEKAVENLQTELTASAKEVKVSSPVLGVIILIISLLFFYLYLAFVYPITEIF